MDKDGKKLVAENATASPYLPKFYSFLKRI